MENCLILNIIDIKGYEKEDFKTRQEVLEYIKKIERTVTTFIIDIRILILKPLSKNDHLSGFVSFTSTALF